MSSLIFKSTIFFIFLIIIKGVHGYFYPLCTRNEIGCEGEELHESNEKTDKNLLSILAVTVNCAICSILSSIKIFYYDVLPKSNIILTTGKSFKYKPPPSLFETLAIWTGVKKEENIDDENWEAQKIFMLASTIICSMLLLYYGQNWFSTWQDIKELKSCRVCHYCKKQLSPSSSFATCTCEQEED